MIFIAGVNAMPIILGIPKWHLGRRERFKPSAELLHHRGELKLRSDQ